MSHNQAANHFSNEFKDIINIMLDYYPSRRLMMADLIAHPWMQGEYPTEEEIQSELAYRKNENQQEETLETEPSKHN